MGIQICHLNELEANTKLNKHPHLPATVCILYNNIVPQMLQLIHQNDIYSYNKIKLIFTTYNEFPHITRSSWTSGMSTRADFSSFILDLYQIYFPLPSSPPKYVFCGTTISFWQQSGITRSIPTGSAVEGKNNYRKCGKWIKKSKMTAD